MVVVVTIILNQRPAQHHQAHDILNIVDPILVVDITTRKMAIKIVLHTPIKWVVTRGIALVGAVLSLPEMNEGNKIQ